jgi:hypothetical protein
MWRGGRIERVLFEKMPDISGLRRCSSMISCNSDWCMCFEAHPPWLYRSHIDSVVASPTAYPRAMSSPPSTVLYVRSSSGTSCAFYVCRCERVMYKARPHVKTCCICCAHALEETLGSLDQDYGLTYAVLRMFVWSPISVTSGGRSCSLRACALRLFSWLGGDCHAAP